MSDLLGNHSLVLATDYVAAQDISNDFNFAASYKYYGKRPTYRVSIFNWNQYFINDRNFIIPGRSVTRGISRLQQRGALANASYPLDLYRRLDLSYTYVGEQEEQVYPSYEPDSTSVSTHLFKTAYVHDSITYGLLGATAGKRYFLSVGRTLNLGSAMRSFSHLEFDYRHYLRLGRWSVLGLRAYSVGSLGRDALKYNLGGPTWYLPFYTGFNLNTGPLRGYQFSAFTGSRVLLTNAELRVPFCARYPLWLARHLPDSSGGRQPVCGCGHGLGQGRRNRPVAFPQSTRRSHVFPTAGTSQRWLRPLSVLFTADEL